MAGFADLNTPLPHSGAMPFWFWNGAMEKGRLIEQLRIMREAGIDEFIIHARYGLQTAFMSEAWLGAVEAVVREAARTGMHVWIYDEVNWPSGTCGGTIPTENVDFREHRLDEQGRLQSLDGIKGSSPARNVDYLNRAATEEFIRRCYEPYQTRIGEHFGKTVRGFFNDEVRFFHARPWSTSLREPVPAGGKYFGRIGELMAENTFAPIRAWCQKRGLELIGHVMGEEGLGSQVRYVGDIYRVLAEFHQPGIDHLGTAAAGLHPRVAASVAHWNGNPAVTSETFAGNPWDFKVEDLFRISGWLYASGITRVILHGFYYERELEANKSDWPPDIFYRWEHWKEIGPYVVWARRVQAFLAASEAVSRVAIVVPLEEFWEDYEPDTAFCLDFAEGPRVAGERARRLHVGLTDIGNELLRRGIDFDFVPRAWLGRVPENRLLVLPEECEAEFAGRKVKQGGRTAAQCAAEVDGMLGRRVRVRGAGAEPNPTRINERLSDPYVHGERDDGGVLVRSVRYQGRPAHLVWNANATAFRGKVDLPEQRGWTLWRPDSGEMIQLGVREELEIELPAWRMAVVLAT